MATITDIPRKEALPENIEYRDSGCSLHPSCLTCPFAQCIFDLPQGRRTMFTDELQQTIVKLRDAGGKTIEAIAAELGISRRTVFRHLARGRA